VELRIFPNVKDLPYKEWEQAFSSGYPFLKQRFLKGLESSGSTNGDSGWQNCHLALFDDEKSMCSIGHGPMLGTEVVWITTRNL
jgi:predicted N-acyltransferase